MYASPASIDELNELLLSVGLQLESPLTPATETALSTVLSELGLDSLDLLVEALNAENSDALFGQVVSALTKPQRPFFQDYKSFKFIRKAVFPYLAKQARTEPLSVLVVGDGIDTDVFSLSILADESSWGTESPLNIQGYDISAVKAASYQAGIFGAHTVASSMPSAFVKTHFEECPQGWKLKDRHLERCTFSTTRPELQWPTDDVFDLVLLRNVMTYLPTTAQKEVLEELKTHLRPGSFVISTGSSKVLDESSDFKATKVESIRCFRYKVTTSKSRSQTATQQFNVTSQQLQAAAPKQAQSSAAKPRTAQNSFTLELGKLARNIYLFDKMPAGELEEICEKVQLCSFTPGEAILSQGEKGDAFFVIKSGLVRVEVEQGKLKKPLKVAELKRGQIFGEMSLILDEPCSASVLSESDVEAYMFTQKLFDYLRFENDLFAERLDEIVLERRADTANKKAEETSRLAKEKLAVRPKPAPKSSGKSSTKVRTTQVPMTDDRFSSLVRHVRDVELFKNLTGRDMEMVSSRVTCWNYPSGNRLITQGHKGSAFYILNKGNVSIQVKQGLFGKKKEVAKLEPGQLFGEISLILDQKCTADVVASDDVEAFVFNRDLFKFLIENNEPFRKTIEEIAIERRADTAKKR